MDQEIKKEFENLTKGIQNLTEEVKGSKIDIHDLKVGLDDLTNEVKSSKADIQNLTKEMTSVKSNVQNLTKEVEGSKTDIQNLTKEMESSKKDFEDLTQIVQESFSHVEKEIISVKRELKADMGKLNIELRDFIDDKIDNLKGDIILLTRKEDAKLITLVETLQKKDSLTDKEAKQIFKMEPFPRLVKSHL